MPCIHRTIALWHFAGFYRAVWTPASIAFQLHFDVVHTNYSGPLTARRRPTLTEWAAVDNALGYDLNNYLQRLTYVDDFNLPQLQEYLWITMIFDSRLLEFVGTCEASIFDSISNRTSDSVFDSYWWSDSKFSNRPHRQSPFVKKRLAVVKFAFKLEFWS